MVEGGMKCIKYLLFLFNLLFVIAGIALIAAGAYVKIKLEEYSDFFGSKYVEPGILLIVVGVIIFLIAFFGCCGAYREQYCLTMTYAAFLAIIFILEMSGGIAAFVLRDDIETDLKKFMTDAEKKYGKSGEDGITKAWNKLQNEFECCGVNNATDWKKNNNTRDNPPESCCAKSTGNCTYADTYSEGCYEAFEDWIKAKIAIIGGVGIGLAFVQVVGILFACCLARAIRKEYEVV